MYGCVGVLGGRSTNKYATIYKLRTAAIILKTVISPIKGFWHSECSCTVPELAMRLRYSCISVRLCNPCSWAARLLTSSWSKLDQPLEEKRWKRWKNERGRDEGREGGRWREVKKGDGRRKSGDKEGSEEGRWRGDKEADRGRQIEGGDLSCNGIS